MNNPMSLYLWWNPKVVAVSLKLFTAYSLRLIAYSSEPDSHFSQGIVWDFEFSASNLQKS
jgi:hypothetical protein